MIVDILPSYHHDIPHYIPLDNQHQPAHDLGSMASCGSQANMAVGNSTAKLKTFFDEAPMKGSSHGKWMVYAGKAG